MTGAFHRGQRGFPLPKDAQIGSDRGQSHTQASAHRSWTRFSTRTSNKPRNANEYYTLAPASFYLRLGEVAEVARALRREINESSLPACGLTTSDSTNGIADQCSIAIDGAHPGKGKITFSCNPIVAISHFQLHQSVRLIQIQLHRCCEEVTRPPRCWAFSASAKRR